MTIVETFDLKFGVGRQFGPTAHRIHLMDLRFNRAATIADVI